MEKGDGPHVDVFMRRREILERIEQEDYDDLFQRIEGLVEFMLEREPLQEIQAVVNEFSVLLQNNAADDNNIAEAQPEDPEEQPDGIIPEPQGQIVLPGADEEEDDEGYWADVSESDSGSDEDVPAPALPPAQQPGTSRKRKREEDDDPARKRVRKGSDSEEESGSASSSSSKHPKPRKHRGDEDEEDGRPRKRPGF